MKNAQNQKLQSIKTKTTKILNHKKEVKGITLVSLIVTIIVLLILAGITINTLTGDNGIINTAIEAKEQTKTAEILERVQKKVIAYEEAEEKSYIEIKEFFKKTYSQKLIETRDNGYILTEENRVFYIDLGTDNVTVREQWDGSISEGFNSGDGTESNPFIISNAEELAYFSKYVGEGNTCSGQFVKLSNDIILNQYVEEEKLSSNNFEKFTPIVNFEGTFDGDDYTIYGLYEESTGSLGLFTTINNANIKNVNIAGAYIKGGDKVGGIAGTATGKVLNCTVEGKIVGSLSVAGIIASAGSSLEVQNCINYADVKGTSYQCAGIIGFAQRGTSILKCGNEGNITGYNECGGIIGKTYNWPSAVQCYNKGNVSGNSNVGGINGFSQSGTGNCYNTANITGISYVGGISGKVVENSWEKTYMCYSIGSVTANTYVGDVLGNNGGSISKLFYYNGTNGAVNGADIEGQAEKITEEQLYSKQFWIDNSYSETVWKLIDENMPILKWEL